MQVSGVKIGQRRLIIDADDIYDAGDRGGIVQGTGGSRVATVVERHRDCAQRVGVCPGRVLAAAGERDLAKQSLRCRGGCAVRCKCNHQVAAAATSLGTDRSTVVQHT